jgi:hypothetical protein
MDYLGKWGGGGPGHSWAQMALASLLVSQVGSRHCLESWAVEKNTVGR